MGHWRYFMCPEELEELAVQREELQANREEFEARFEALDEELAEHQGAWQVVAEFNIAWRLVPGQVLAAKGNDLFFSQRTGNQAQPVAVSQDLVVSVHGSHGIFAVHDGGQRVHRTDCHHGTFKRGHAVEGQSHHHEFQNRVGTQLVPGARQGHDAVDHAAPGGSAGTDAAERVGFRWRKL
ncbi:SAM-dependent methyltransferase, partial [Alcaligenes faecalis subsp. faecalis NCIB 8687]